jgi:hypothetical protein
MFYDLLEQLHFAYIFISATLFLLGIYLAPFIVDRDIKWLLLYPRWVKGIMEKYFSGKWGFFPIFLLILFLNNISLFTGFISGLLLLPPVLLIFLTGFHVAVIGYDLMGWEGIWHLLVNPVAWVEFPAAWISFGLGLRLSTEWISKGSISPVLATFYQLAPLYFKYVFSLLVIAGIIESFLIIIAERHKDKL